MTAVDIGQLKAGVIVWTKGENEYGDGATGGMVVDYGIDDTHGDYVVALVASPAYPKTSHKRRQWIYTTQDGGGTRQHGQVAELRRFYVSDLQPTDGFRDATKCLGYAAKALLAAGLAAGEWSERRAELDRAAHALIDAATEIRESA